MRESLVLARPRTPIIAVHVHANVALHRYLYADLDRERSISLRRPRNAVLIENDPLLVRAALSDQLHCKLTAWRATSMM
jgi:hypothetical protein